MSKWPYKPISEWPIEETSGLPYPIGRIGPDGEIYPGWFPGPGYKDDPGGPPSVEVARDSAPANPG